MLMAKAVTCLLEPHNFDVNEQLQIAGGLVRDPEGNIFQTVCQR
ncbi:MAG: hypothetical protein R2867_45320 [Caldilineaceae bacterium]